MVKKLCDRPRELLDTRECGVVSRRWRKPSRQVESVDLATKNARLLHIPNEETAQADTVDLLRSKIRFDDLFKNNI